MEQNIEKILNTVERLEHKLDSCVIEIKLLKDKVKVVEDENKQLLNVTRKLEEQVDRLENQSRRNNIVVYGVQEVEEENWNKTENILINLIKEKLKINLQEQSIERAHRLGKIKTGKRPIIAKFSSFKVKEEIIRNAKMLKNTGLAVSEDFSRRVKEERNNLKPLLNIAKQQGCRAFLSYNKLSIDGKKFNHEEACNLLNVNGEEQTTAVPENEDISKDIAEGHQTGAIRKKLPMERPKRKVNK